MASTYFKLKMLRKKRNAVKKIRRDCIGAKLSTDEITTTANYVKKCRICLQDGNISIYGNESFNECAEYIRQFGDIEINQNDEFPKYLCSTCQSHLQNAVLFRRNAKHSDTILRQNFNCRYNNTHNDSDLGEEIFPDDNKHEGLTKTYKCLSCNLNFVTLTEYIVHKNSKQHKNVRIQCPICYGLFTAQMYKKHLARHQSTSHLVCDVCGKLYRKDNLLRHLQLHSYSLPHRCQVCPYRGRFVESLKIHMRTHTGDRPFSCDKCQLCFLTRSNLNRHLLTHKKERPFKCSECDRGFYVKRDLDVHCKADHAGIKDYGCKICGNKYGTKKSLMRHELRVHKRDKLSKGRMPLYLQAEYRQ